MKVDMHLHTRYSPDANASLKGIIRRCQQTGIGCVAVTDHNTIEGALRMKDLAPFPVIVGEEVMSSEGEIIGYFLTEEIPKGIPPQEVIARIKNQGGLVCLPHPFDGFGRFPLKAEAREALLSQIDIIEVFNARSIRNNFSDQAQLFAKQHGFLCSAGSDAHSVREVGNAYVEINDFNDSDEFKSALNEARFFGQRNSVIDRVATGISTLPKRLRSYARV